MTPILDELKQTRLELDKVSYSLSLRTSSKQYNPFNHDRKRVRLEMTNYCLALDPGGTTGVCLVRDEANPWSLEVTQFEGEHHTILFAFLLKFRPSIVICESFENRSQEAARLASREHIGIVKAYLGETGATGVWQTASTGKAFWTDTKLRKAGLYVPGLRHARDAIRHYAYWRTFKERDKWLLNGGIANVSANKYGKENPQRST